MEVRQTRLFSEWLAGLRDIHARQGIRARIRRLTLGNLGDWKSVGEGVGEIRLHIGPGYRLYFTRRGEELVILLCGGDKSSQARDITKAQMLAKEL